jgi:hypothetical protein
MQHLDDGQIAELIDSTDRRTGGPADATDRRTGGPADPAVEDHLRVCGVCRERVGEARQIAARAKAILGTAVPGGSAGSVVPPFEEVLHRAGRARVRRARLGATRWLAWAATLVIAGGVGWYARDQLGFPHDTFRPAGASQESAARAEPETTAAVAAAPTQVAVTERAVPAEEQKSQVANEGQVSTPAPPPSPLAVGGTARQKAAEADRLVAGGRGDQAAGAAAPPVAQNLAAPTQERLEARRSAAEAEAPVMAKMAADVADALDERGWIPATREAAEQALGGPVVTVEGLPVVSYRLRTIGGVEVRTVQSLGAGMELELRQSKLTLARGAVATAPAPEARARGAELPSRAAAEPATDTVEIDRFRIVGRAPISLDSLRALLRKIKP